MVGLFIDEVDYLFASRMFSSVIPGGFEVYGESFLLTILIYVRSDSVSPDKHRAHLRELDNVAFKDLLHQVPHKQGNDLEVVTVGNSVLSHPLSVVRVTCPDVP